jgi:hypothetical protein
MIATEEEYHQRMIFRMKRMGLVGGNLAFFWLIALTCLSVILLCRLLINNSSVSSVSTDEKDHQRMIFRMKRMGLVGGNLAFFWLIALTCLSVILLCRLLINNSSITHPFHPLIIR